METNQDISLKHFVIENVLSEWFEMNGNGFIVSLEGNILVGVVTLREDTGICSFEEGARKHLDQCLKVPYQMVVSRLLTDFHSIPDEIKNLQLTGFSALKKDVPASKNDETITIALQYIRGHFQDTLSLEKVASIVYLNPIYFSQLFKQKTGIGYKDYVTQLRMERAKELLANRGLRVTDVARLVGYDDLRHFTQVFRKNYHCTPTEYRNELT